MKSTNVNYKYGSVWTEKTRGKKVKVPYHQQPGELLAAGDADGWQDEGVSSARRLAAFTGPETGRLRGNPKVHTAMPTISLQVKTFRHHTRRVARTDF